MRATHRSWRAWLSGVALGLGLIADVRAQGPAPPRVEAAVPPASSRSNPGVEPAGVRGPRVIPLVLQGGRSEVPATGAEPGSGPGQALVAAQPPTTVEPPEVVPPPPRPIEPGGPPRPRAATVPAGPRRAPIPPCRSVRRAGSRSTPTTSTSARPSNCSAARAG